MKNKMTQTQNNLSANDLGKAQQFILLTETSAGTPMGKLLRRFWHPVAISNRLATGKALALRVLGEDLTLYRGESGHPHLVGGRCAHRRTVLHTGWVEGEQIRCMYHGWRYDGSGQCTEMPAEKRASPGGIKLAGYPLNEYHGLIFAYMGDGEAPAFDLPRKDLHDEKDRQFAIREQTWDCNWFQQVENSLDAVHVSFVHVWGRVSRFGDEITTAIPELSYSETDAGIRQVATRSSNNVRISDWTFPNNNHIVGPGPEKTDPWTDSCVWAVPIDDESAMRFIMYSWPSAGAENDRRIAADRVSECNPADHHDALFRQHSLPEMGHSLLQTAQDYVAVRGQGVYADRLGERLGQSDAGIALLRRIFFRELEAIQAGKPTKRWLKLPDAEHLPIQIPELEGTKR